MEGMLYNDDDTRDEFFAQDFFKNQATKENILIGIDYHKNALEDITNQKISFNQNNQNFHLIKDRKNSKIVTQPILNNKNLINQKCNLSKNISSRYRAMKRRNDSGVDLENKYEFDTQKLDDISGGDNYFITEKRKKNYINKDKALMFKDFLKNNVEYQEFSISKIASIHNGKYITSLVVTESLPRILKMFEDSDLKRSLLASALTDENVYITPHRKCCSPQEQFIISDKNQYESQCLIRSHLSKENKILDIGFEPACGLRQISQTNKTMSSVINNNTFVFHELFLEKLPCNKLSDFMPDNKNLTGIILGGVIDNYFDLSNHESIKEEVIHTAVDYIYQFLSRVNDVTLVDLQWIAFGALSVASKYEGAPIKKIEEYTGFKKSDLCKAELRLITAIDFNISKPHAISFRNRYLQIEMFNSTLLHISNFLLDMCLHSYTIMLLPASQRAAACVWLSRLIDKFESYRDDENLWNNKKNAENTMQTVWPENYEKLTGYKHSDIALLAIQIHVVVLAFIRGGKPNYSSVKGCFEKYSSKNYGSLSISYERFTSITVYRASKLYCEMNNLDLSRWMVENEYQMLLRSVKNKMSIVRTTSTPILSPVQLVMCNSCPEITLNPSVRPELNIQSKPFSSGVLKDLSNRLNIDSGYDTSNSSTNL